jgi:hypothetical protein
VRDNSDCASDAVIKSIGIAHYLFLGSAAFKVSIRVFIALKNAGLVNARMAQWLKNVPKNTQGG